MRYWDASAIVPLILPEPQSQEMAKLLADDPVMLVWWGTPVECASAVARREQEGALPADEAGGALERLRALSEAWQEVLPAEIVRRTAVRLLRVHPLRTADAFQLAAAVAAAEGEPETLPFVCLDSRLNEAAAREGLRTGPRDE